MLGPVDCRLASHCSLERLLDLELSLLIVVLDIESRGELSHLDLLRLVIFEDLHRPAFLFYRLAERNTHSSCRIGPMPVELVNSLE